MVQHFLLPCILLFSPNKKSCLNIYLLWGMPVSKDEARGKIVSRQKGEISVVAWSSGNSFFLSAGQDSLCRMWSPSGEAIQAVHHGEWITALAVSPDSKQYATGAMDQKIKLWSIKDTVHATATFEEHTAAVVALAYSPDGKYLAGRDEKNLLNIRNKQGKLILSKQMLGKNLSGFGAITSIGFSHDSKLLVIGGTDGSAKVLDLQGNILQSYRTPYGGLSSVGFSNDDSTILVAGDDGMARQLFRIKAYLQSERAARY